MEQRDTKDILIQEYFPQLKDITTLVPLLKSMGLNSHNIQELLSTRHFDSIVRIIDPDTDKEYLVFSEFGGIHYTLEEVEGQWCVFINNKPYKTFFQELEAIEKRPLTKKGEFLDEVSENIVYSTAIREFQKEDPEAYEKLVKLLIEKGMIFFK